MSKTQEAAELTAKLARLAYPEYPPGSIQCPARLARDALKLMRLSASLRGIAERQCNGDAPKCDRCLGRGDFVRGTPSAKVTCPDCDGSGWNTRRERSLIQAVTDTLRPYGLIWKHNTDPRGAAVGILFPDGSFNTMGGEETGWRI